jgi:hypothetical protein
LTFYTSRRNGGKFRFLIFGLRRRSTGGSSVRSIFSGLTHKAAPTALLLAITVVGLPASAGNLTYRYDSLGRLNRVCNALPGSGELTSYTLDAADNRSRYTNTKTDIVFAPDSAIWSADNQYQLRFQSDGNLVVYGPGSQPRWGSLTNGGGYNMAYFQSDGNLVLYRPSGTSWSTNTSQYPCARLEMGTDGYARIFSADGQEVWRSSTSGR